MRILSFGDISHLFQHQVERMQSLEKLTFARLLVNELRELATWIYFIHQGV